VRFTAEKQNGVYLMMEIQIAQSRGVGPEGHTTTSNARHIPGVWLAGPLSVEAVLDFGTLCAAGFFRLAPHGRSAFPHPNGCPPATTGSDNASSEVCMAWMKAC